MNFPKRKVDRVVTVDQLRADPIVIGMRCFVAYTYLRDQPQGGEVTLVVGSSVMKGTEEAMKDRLNAVYMAAKAIQQAESFTKANKLEAAHGVVRRNSDCLTDPLTLQVLAPWLGICRRALDNTEACLRQHNSRIRSDVGAGVV